MMGKGKSVRRVLLIIGMLAVSSVVYAQGPPPAKVVLGEVVTEEVSTTHSVTGVIYYERVSDISTKWLAWWRK